MGSKGDSQDGHLMTKRERSSGATITCEQLRSRQKCFKLQRYNRGSFVELFHVHVPAHRISFERAIEVLRTLVARYSEFAAMDIVRCNLNRRGRNPEALRRLDIHVQYPEPGVIRRACGGDVVAFMDEVINPDRFRLSLD